MLSALGNRADRPQRKSRTSAATSTATPAEAFHLYRQARSQRARTLNALLIPLNDDYTIPLRRAPDIRQACTEAYGPAKTASVTSLRALLGVMGAHEWRTKGIELPEAGGRIHPHFGVFAPIRREYVDLVSATPLPAGCIRPGACASSCVAFDIGTGGHRSFGRSSRFTLRTIRAIPQRNQHLACLLKVTAPEKRRPLTCETIGLVCRHSPVSDNGARGRWCTAVGTPPRLECLAVFEPVNDRVSAAVSHEFAFQCQSEICHSIALTERATGADSQA